WRFAPDLREAQAPAPPDAPQHQQAAATPAAPPAAPKPTPTPAPAPAAAPAPTPALTPAATAQKALVAQAQRAALEARAVSDKIKEAVDAARSMAGEAKIVAARAAVATLENAQRVNTDDGASYVGQVAEGKGQG